MDDDIIRRLKRLKKIIDSNKRLRGPLSCCVLWTYDYNNKALPICPLFILMRLIDILIEILSKNLLKQSAKNEDQGANQ